jgi:hypothetical protein
MHFTPGVCELFLKSSKQTMTPNRKEELRSENNLDGARYKEWEKQMKNVKDEARRLFNKYQKDLVNYQLYIVRGLYQNSDIWGALMAKGILGLDTGTAVSSPQKSTYSFVSMTTFEKIDPTRFRY